MTNNVIVSVILPTFNRASVVPEAIRSVLAQTIREIELIIVDDASKDNTIAVVESIADPRITIVKNSIQLGVSKSRNRGIAAARGPYVAFQDSDDVWLPSKLEDELFIIQSASNRYGLVFSDHIRNNFGRFDLIPNVITEISEECMFSRLLIQNLISTQTLLVRLDLIVAIGGFDENLPRYVDWDLVLRLSKITRFAHIAKVKSIVNVSKISITTDIEIDFVARRSIYSKYKNELTAHPEAHLAHLVALSRSAMLSLRILKGLYFAFLSIYFFPMRISAWMSLARAICTLPRAVFRRLSRAIC